MIGHILHNGGGASLVDNHGTNAFMHAGGHGNLIFVTWFYDRCSALRQGGFDFNHKNKRGRNALSLVRQNNTNAMIVAKLMDLVKKKLLEELVHEVIPERPDRFGGISDAHQREHPRVRHASNKMIPAVEGTVLV